MPDNVEFQGVNILTEVSVLDEGIPLTDTTKMYVNNESTFRQIGFSRLLDWMKGQITKTIHPVGSVYMTFDSVNPSTLFGGTWEKIEDKFLLGSGTNAIGAEGGESEHTLTVAEMPSHTHNATISNGGEHNHPVTIKSNGNHTHTVTVASAGNHSHTPSKTEYYFTLNKNLDDEAAGDIVARRKNNLGSNGGYYVMTTKGDIDDLQNCATTSTDGAHTHNTTVSTTGAHTHETTVGGASAHTHTATVTSTGQGSSHNNMPPYLVVNIWRRIA